MLLKALAPILLASATPASLEATRGTAEIEATFQAIQSATRARDVATLEKLVDEEYVMIHGYGPSEPRSAWLSMVQQGTLARQRSEGLERDVRVRLFGETAVRSWIVRLRRAEQKQDTWIHGTATFSRRDNRWRMVQGQSTLLHEGPTVDVADIAAFVGTYAVPNRPTFKLRDGGGYLALKWANGAEMPLIPLGGDRFVSAYGSTMHFHRDESGDVLGATRIGIQNRELFRATRSR